LKGSATAAPTTATPTSCRDVFAEILEKRMSLRDLKPVFPGYTLDDKKRLGVIVA
jgi:hypothetical protein